MSKSQLSTLVVDGKEFEVVDQVAREQSVHASRIQNIWTGTCSTAETTAVKVVTLDNPDGFSLANGVTICVYFANGSSANNPTLNVNNTGNKPVYYMTSSVAGSMIGSKVPHKYFGVGCHIFTYNNDRWYRDFGDMANIDYLNTQLGAMSLAATDLGNGIAEISLS